MILDDLPALDQHCCSSRRSACRAIAALLSLHYTCGMCASAWSCAHRPHTLPLESPLAVASALHSAGRLLPATADFVASFAASGAVAGSAAAAGVAGPASPAAGCKVALAAAAATGGAAGEEAVRSIGCAVSAMFSRSDLLCAKT